MIAVGIAVGVVLTFALVGFAQRRDADASALLDVAPFVAPAEPWPVWLPLPAERRAHWRPGTDAYDAQNVILRTWPA